MAKQPTSASGSEWYQRYVGRRQRRSQPEHLDIMMIGHFAKDRVVVDGQEALAS